MPMTIARLKNSYEDLLAGNVRMPVSANEKVAFQAMMVASMVTCMVTFNEFLHIGSAFIAALCANPFVYLETFCIAFTVRTLIGNPITGRIIGTIIAPRFRALRKVRSSHAPTSWSWQPSCAPSAHFWLGRPMRFSSHTRARCLQPGQPPSSSTSLQ